MKAIEPKELQQWSALHASNAGEAAFDGAVVYPAASDGDGGSSMTTAGNAIENVEYLEER